MSGGEASTVRLDAVLRDLVDRMAHQLKNPMQAVIVNLEVVRLHTGREGDRAAEVEPFARAVEESVRSLDRRLRLLIQVSRAADEEPASIAPLEMVEDLVGALHLDRDPRPVRLAPEMGDRRERTVRARPGHLVACLSRLIDMARASANGRVEVALVREAAALELRFEVERGGVERSSGRPPEAPEPVIGDPPLAEGWSTVTALAREAGAELERETRGPSEIVRLRFRGA